MNETKIFASIIDDETKKQVVELSKSEAYKGRTIRVMPDCHAGKGCTIGTVIDIDNRIIPNTVGVDIGCLDCDTEVLTPKGWIKIAEYNGEEIMQYSPKTDNGVFMKPLAFVKGLCKEFYHFKNSKGLDQMLSEEHRMLVFQGQKDNIRAHTYHPDFFIDKKDLIKGYYRFKTSFYTNEKGVDISNELIRLSIMVQADGRVREYDDYNFIELHLKKQRKIERAKLLLDDAGITFNESVLKDGTTSISFHAPKVIDKNLKRYYKASYNQLQIIAEECLLWDGHLEGETHNFYSSTNKENADVIQFAFIATNIRASIYTNKGKLGWKDCYNVVPTKNSYVGYTVKPQIVPSKDGYKYCFTTDTGYFLCRRNNYTFLTGNCGMLVVKLGKQHIDLSLLDEVINEKVPSGFNIHEKPRTYTRLIDSLFCHEAIDNDIALRSIGTLGGGNHFIELDEDEKGNRYLVIHSGSRNLGKRVCEYWQKKAIEYCEKKAYDEKAIIAQLKSECREKEIAAAIKEAKAKAPKINKELAYVEGLDASRYLYDMEICQAYAVQNRSKIAEIICENVGLHSEGEFTTIHNYIDMPHGILRKGAVSALRGYELIIPMNMRDGSLLCIGKGNLDWLYSAPHGAGRLMSRKQAKEQLKIEDFEQSMKGIYTTSVCEATIDEAPMVYKPMEEIRKCIEPTVTVVAVLKPLYNFKAKEISKF